MDNLTNSVPAGDPCRFVFHSGRPSICILGNSVGLKIRPPRSSKCEKTFGEHLRDFGWEVTNHCRAGVEIGDAFARFDDDILSKFPDAVIFNFGVVEVSRRRIPRRIWYGSILHTMFLNRIAGRPHPGSRWWERCRRLPWRLGSSVIESLATAFGISWSWTSPKQLALIHREMLELLFKETSAIAFVLGINPCTERVEKRLPGTSRAIVTANRLLRAEIESFSRAVFLDPAECFNEMSLSEFAPDGVHYSANAHRRIAEIIDQSLRVRIQSMNHD